MIGLGDLRVPVRSGSRDVDFQISSERGESWLGADDSAPGVRR